MRPRASKRTGVSTGIRVFLRETAGLNDGYLMSHRYRRRTGGGIRRSYLNSRGTVKMRTRAQDVPANIGGLTLLGNCVCIKNRMSRADTLINYSDLERGMLT